MNQTRILEILENEIIRQADNLTIGMKNHSKNWDRWDRFTDRLEELIILKKEHSKEFKILFDGVNKNE